MWCLPRDAVFQRRYIGHYSHHYSHWHLSAKRRMIYVSMTLLQNYITTTFSTAGLSAHPLLSSALLSVYFSLLHFYSIFFLALYHLVSTSYLTSILKFSFLLQNLQVSHYFIHVWRLHCLLTFIILISSNSTVVHWHHFLYSLTVHVIENIRMPKSNMRKNHFSNTRCLYPTQSNSQNLRERKENKGNIEEFLLWFLPLSTFTYLGTHKARSSNSNQWRPFFLKFT